MKGSFYSSEFTNSTFKNITTIDLSTHGGVLYMNTSSDINMTIDRCIFVLCKAYQGGVIYLYKPSFSIGIIRCRFEDNNGSSGSDIYTHSSSSSCLSNAIIDSCTTSVSEGVICFDSYLNTSTSFDADLCVDKIVCLCCWVIIFDDDFCIVNCYC